MNPELRFHLRAFSRLIYFVTDEEDRFLVQFRTALRDKVVHAKVYNGAFGLVPLATLIDDWKSKAHRTDATTINIHDALIAVYKEEAPGVKKFYVITDPERWLKDEHVQRRVLNILHQVHNDTNTVKVLVCVGSRRFIPEKLSRYTEVVQDTGLSPDEILEFVGDTCKSLKLDIIPEDSAEVFKGLTSFEIRASMIQTYKRTKGDLDPKLLSSYRHKQLRKTDLVQHIDTSLFSFANVGGIGRFKAWATRTKAAWSEEGRAFGLEPPKGVLAVGVWGAGKSLSVKALGNEWGLPVVQLEMGKLR